MADSKEFADPKFRMTSAGESGVLVATRLFGSRATLRRAAEFILVALAALPKDYDLDTEAGTHALRDAQELEFHARSVLGGEMPPEIQEAAKAYKWRAERTDAYYTVGAMTRYRGVLENVPAKFEAPKVPKDGAVGFWEWHSAVNRAMAAAEVDVKAGVAPKNISSKVAGQTIKAVPKAAPIPPGVPAGGTTKPAATIDLVGGAGTPGGTLAATPPGRAGAKRKASHVTPTGVDVASITEGEMKMIVRAKKLMSVSFFEAVDLVLGEAGDIANDEAIGSLAVPDTPPVVTPNPSVPPLLARKAGGSAQPFWTLGGGQGN